MKSTLAIAAALSTALLLAAEVQAQAPAAEKLADGTVLDIQGVSASGTSGRQLGGEACPPLRAKRTSIEGVTMSGFDPKET